MHTSIFSKFSQGVHACFSHETKVHKPQPNHHETIQLVVLPCYQTTSKAKPLLLKAHKVQQVIKLQLPEADVDVVAKCMYEKVDLIKKIISTYEVSQNKFPMISTWVHHSKQKIPATKGQSSTSPNHEDAPPNRRSIGA